MGSKVSKESAEKMLALVSEHEKKGNVILLILDGEVVAMKLDEIVEQPVDGLLYDLNRDKVTCLSWIGDGERGWVNNYASALVIEKLYGQRTTLRAENAALQAVVDAAHRFKKAKKAKNRADAQLDMFIALAALEDA